MMVGIFDTLSAVVGEKRIRQREPLETHTVLKTQAVAEMYVEIDKLDTFIKVIREARKSNVPVYILGGGARIKTEHDIQGLVIKNMCRHFDKVTMKGKVSQNGVGVDEVLVYAEAGVIMNQLVRFTIDEGLEGLEYQLGLPGTVGGAIYTNAKYIPKYLLVNQSLQSVSLLNENGETQSYSGSLPHFVYTDEFWEETKDIILSAVFKLTPSDKKMLWERAEEAGAWRAQESEKRLANSVK